MSAPRLNRRLALEEETALPDGAGGLVVVWALVGHVWGEVRPGAGTVADGEEVVLSRQSYRITVRGVAQGTPSRPEAGQRFRDGTRVFAILAVTERDPDGLYLTCAALEEEPT